MKIISAVLFFLLSLTGYSQYQIHGNVTNEKDSALLGVNVSIYSLPDTSFVDGIISNTSGEFELELENPGKYQVLFSYVGYRIEIKELDIKSDSKIDLGTIVLTEDDELLDEVEIKDRIVRVEMNGDTVEFNANAYKLNKSALLEDLIKQLPGVSYKDGQLIANGEPVTRITIDGQDFFGDDILIALKNLPAEMIAKVQLFNKEEDEGQNPGGSKEQGINLVTKEGMNKGVFGRIEGGIGTDDRYQIDGMINFFKPKTRLSLFFISNNINQQNFNYQEVTSTTEQGYESFYDLYSGDDNGIATTSAIGINFNQKLKGKSQIGFSYLLNKKDVANDKRSNQQFFINDSTSQNYYEESIFRKSTFQQTFTTNFEWKKDSTQSLRFRPQLTLQSQDENNGISAVNSFNEGVQLNELMSVLQTNHQNIEAKGELRYNYKFKNKKGRRFNTRIDYQYQKNNSEYELNSENTFFLSDSTNNIDQLSESVSNGYNIDANLYYNEPIFEGLSLSFGINSSYRNDVSDWETNRLNPTTNVYEIPDYNLTNLFERNESKISPNASLRFGNDTISGWAGFRSEWSELYLSQEIPENTSLNNQFLNPLPYAGFRFSKGKAFRVILWYYTRTQLPSTTQLQPIVNNVNPLFLTVGNPNLDRAYIHQIGLNLSGYNKKNSQSYSAYIHYMHSLSYIGQNRVWAQTDTMVNDVNISQGSQYTVFQNYGYSNSAYFYLNYTIPIDAIGSNLSFKANGNYRSFPGQINGLENRTENITPNIWANLYTNFSETFQLGLNGGFTLNYSQNTLQEQSNILTKYYTAGLETEWQPEFGLRIEADVSYSTNKGMSESFNLTSWMINGEIGYQFLEEQTLGVYLGVYDLLNQNIGVFRNVTDMQINDVSNTVLTQFFYVKLSWQLRYFKGKKTEEKGG